MTASNINNLQNTDYEKYWQKAIGYDKYLEQMAEDRVSNSDEKMKEYINLNWHRMQRVEKTYHPSPEVIEQLEKLDDQILWLVLTEHWCGDAGQILPALNKIALAGNGKIVMRLIYRDQNIELMNAFLTNGTQSIPKIIQLDKDFNVTGTWGPRPRVAQQLVKHLKANAATLATYANELHLWYAKDKQQSLETEISKLLLKTEPLESGEIDANG